MSISIQIGNDRGGVGKAQGHCLWALPYSKTQTREIYVIIHHKISILEGHYAN